MKAIRWGWIGVWVILILGVLRSSMTLPVAFISVFLGVIRLSRIAVDHGLRRPESRGHPRRGARHRHHALARIVRTDWTPPPNRCHVGGRRNAADPHRYPPIWAA